MVDNIFGELESLTDEPLNVEVEATSLEPTTEQSELTQDEATPSEPLTTEVGALAFIVLDMEEKIDAVDKKIDNILQILDLMPKVTPSAVRLTAEPAPASKKKKQGTPGRPTKKQPKIDVAGMKAKSKAKKAAFKNKKPKVKAKPVEVISAPKSKKAVVKTKVVPAKVIRRAKRA